MLDETRMMVLLPRATDMPHGRGPGSAQDYRKYPQLAHHFDVFQMMSASVEPQDILAHLRHYFTAEAQLTPTDKFPFAFSRATPTEFDCLGRLSDFHSLSEEDFTQRSHCDTIVNTNSLRTLDGPVVQGLMTLHATGIFPLPWRSVSGSALNVDEPQAANKNRLGLWRCPVAGATVIKHSAGWFQAG